MPKDMINFRIDTSSIARVPEEVAERLARHRMQEGDVAYGRRGDIGRRVFMGRRQTGWLCGTGSLRLRPDPSRISARYFFDALGAPETFGTIAGRAKGATLPNLNATVMETVPILVPSRSLQDIYTEAVQPMLGQVDVLTEQNEKLRAARDVLLPRLISGEIAV
jgi:type I restriction enzyme S subunit